MKSVGQRRDIFGVLVNKNGIIFFLSNVYKYLVIRTPGSGSNTVLILCFEPVLKIKKCGKALTQ
jgi:hypothetical protein